MQGGRHGERKGHLTSICSSVSTRNTQYTQTGQDTFKLSLIKRPLLKAGRAHAMLLTLDWKGQGVKATPGIDRQKDRGGKQGAVRLKVRSRQAGTQQRKVEGINTHHSRPALRAPISSHQWNQSGSRGQAFPGTIHTGQPPKAQSRMGRMKTGSRGVNERYPAHLKTHMHTSMTRALPTSPSTHESLQTQTNLAFNFEFPSLLDEYPWANDIISEPQIHHLQNRTNQRDCLRIASSAIETTQSV